MKNFTLYLAVILCLFFKNSNAQSFEQQAKTIADNIERITKDEKKILKTEVETVNIQLEQKTITSQQADEMKLKLAESRAKNIENLVGLEQNKLTVLIKEKVDGKIKELNPDEKRYELSINWKSPRTEKIKKRKELLEAKKDSLGFPILKGNKRTTSQLIFAMGLNNLITNGSVSNSDFRYFGSHFYEWGLTYNTRLSKTDNLLHAKYGFSIMYNNLRPTDNRSFVVSGNQTNLQTSAINYDDSRFKSVYLTLPIHLEFDFSGNKTRSGKPYFTTHDRFRFGVGGYTGINLKSKQYLEYSVNNYDTEQMTNGDFNTSNFIYGFSGYIGHKATSLYIKYDMNPLFKTNLVKQNNVSLGIRFDLN